MSKIGQSSFSLETSVAVKSSRLAQMSVPNSRNIVLGEDECYLRLA